MSDHRSFYKSFENQAAQETQLLAEEKWILDTMKKVRQQINSYQIELLQLESIKSEKQNRSSQINNANTNPGTTTGFKATDCSLAMMQAEGVVTSHPGILELEAQCNNEELDLNVTSSVFDKITSANVVMEEDDEEEPGTSCDDILIDMNMFMNSSFGTDNKEQT